MNALVENKAQIVDTYLSSLVGTTSPEFSDAVIPQEIADQITIPGKPLQRTVVIIPVAAISEQDTIGHAIDEYARQLPIEPFSIVLGLNVDVDKAEFAGMADPAVARTLHNLHDAQKRHPALDIRSAYTEYCAPRIGEIRRDLWNGVLLAYRSDGMSASEEMIAINHDIDVERIPRRYISVIQKRYLGQWGCDTPNYAQTIHGWDAGHPNTSKAVLWTDFIYGASEIGYEAGAVIPMTFYASRGGFEAHRRTHEVASLTNGHIPNKLLRTGRLVTSPRRYIDRLPKAGVDRVWTSYSFGPEDLCRVPEYVADQADLSHDGLVQVLRKGVANDTPAMIEQMTPQLHDEIVQRGLLRPTSGHRTAKTIISNYVTERYTQKLRLAERVLEFCQPEGQTLRKGLDIDSYSFDVERTTNILLKQFTT